MCKIYEFSCIEDFINFIDEDIDINRYLIKEIESPYHEGYTYISCILKCE